MPRAGSRCAGSPPRRSRLPPGRAAAPRGGRRCCWARRSGSGAAALCRCHPRAAPPAPACAAASAPGALKAVHLRQCLGSQHLCCQGLELQTMLRLPQVHMHPPNLPQRDGALCSSTAQGTTRLLRPAGAPGGARIRRCAHLLRAMLSWRCCSISVSGSSASPRRRTARKCPRRLRRASAHRCVK